MSDNDNHRDNDPTILHVCLGLMRELEDSLRSSQTALLALDAAGTERCTREQDRLGRMLRGLLANLASPAAIPARRKSRLEIPLCPPEMTRQLYGAALRVQHLARVQAALLRRSQQFLNVLANWMASPETPYGPPQAAGGGLLPGAVPHAHRGF